MWDDARLPSVVRAHSPVELNRGIEPRKRNYLFPVRVMSKMFRGKFLQNLDVSIGS